MLINKIKNAAINRFYKYTFTFLEGLGLHITPVHFYQPVPDTSTLKDELWIKKSELLGININEDEQLSLLSIFNRYKEEYEELPKEKTSIPHQYYTHNQNFASVDGEILYCMIRFFKPKKIIEIGSGNSSLLITQTIQKNIKENGNYSCEFTVIDPYPNDLISQVSAINKVIPKKVEEVPITEFDKLDENDILFIDSSHVIRIGNDVQYEYLNILPRLKKGVIIHIHDIFLPMEYPKTWVMNLHRFWNEQYILQAFLAFNENFKVLWAGSFMHLNHPDLLATAFNSYNQRHVWPGSFWLKRVR